MRSGAALALASEDTLSHRTPAPLSNQASAHLNMLRGIAALVVLFGHWRSIFFVDWRQVHHRNIVLAFFYGSSKFGHEAVIVFFVLSGYLIGRSVLRTVWAGTWSWKHYAFHRLIRLELVLLPALLLCWFWDSLGIHLFSPSPTYLGAGGSSVLLSDITHGANLHIFFGNMAFLQTLLVPCFGSDQALWSLANEFWYYALFPCLVILLTRRFSWTRRILYAICMIALSFFIGWGMLNGFLIWLLGVLLIFLPKPRYLQDKHFSWLILGFLALIVIQLALTFAPRKIDAESTPTMFLESWYWPFCMACSTIPDPSARFTKHSPRRLLAFPTLCISPTCRCLYSFPRGSTADVSPLLQSSWFRLEFSALRSLIPMPSQ